MWSVLQPVQASLIFSIKQPQSFTFHTGCMAVIRTRLCVWCVCVCGKWGGGGIYMKYRVQIRDRVEKECYGLNGVIVHKHAHTHTYTHTENDKGALFVMTHILQW